jgi:hypothetical protein
VAVYSGPKGSVADNFRIVIRQIRHAVAGRRLVEMLCRLTWVSGHCLSVTNVVWSTFGCRKVVRLVPRSGAVSMEREALLSRLLLLIYCWS